MAHAVGTIPRIALFPDRRVGGHGHAVRPFDFFDPRANTDHPGITAEQRRNRDRLRAATAAGGFANDAMEWWHCTLQPEPSPGLYCNVPVQ